MLNLQKEEEFLTIFQSQQQRHNKTNIDHVIVSLFLRNVAKFRIYSE